MNEQIKYPLGALPSPTDTRDFIRPVTARREPLPSKYELPPVPVKDQSYIGACVAFGVTTSKEIEHAGEHKQPYTRLSEGFAYGNAHDDPYFHKGVGSFPREVLKQMQKWGAPAYGDYSVYAEKPDMVWKVAQDIQNNPALLDMASKNRIGRYYQIDVNEWGIKEALFDTKCAVGFVWSVRGYSISLDYDYNIRPQTQTLNGYHYMAIVGWDDEKQRFKVQNSWHKAWGDNGYCYLRYADVMGDNGNREGMSEAWAIDSELPKNTLRMKIGSKRYTIENGVEGNTTEHEMDVACFLDKNDRTQVPIRFVAEAMGAEVSWHPCIYGIPKKFYPERSYVRIEDSKHSATIRFGLTEAEYTRNTGGGDNRGYTMDTTPFYDAQAGRVFVPVRYVANALQGLVEWDGGKPDDIIIRF